MSTQTIRSSLHAAPFAPNSAESQRRRLAIVPPTVRPTSPQDAVGVSADGTAELSDPYGSFGLDTATIPVGEWGKPGDKDTDCIWNMLVAQGFDPKTIMQKKYRDAHGKRVTLVDLVARVNHLRDPNLVRDGQQLLVPVLPKAERRPDLPKPRWLPAAEVPPEQGLSSDRLTDKALPKQSATIAAAGGTASIKGALEKRSDEIVSTVHATAVKPAEGLHEATAVRGDVQTTVPPKGEIAETFTHESPTMVTSQVTAANEDKTAKTETTIRAVGTPRAGATPPTADPAAATTPQVDIKIVDADADKNTKVAVANNHLTATNPSTNADRRDDAVVTQVDLLDHRSAQPAPENRPNYSTWFGRQGEAIGQTLPTWLGGEPTLNFRTDDVASVDITKRPGATSVVVADKWNHQQTYTTGTSLWERAGDTVDRGVEIAGDAVDVARNKVTSSASYLWSLLPPWRLTATSAEPAKK